MVSDKTRTAAQTAENCIAEFSLTGTPVFDEPNASNNHDAGLFNDVEGLFGDALNTARTRSNNEFCSFAMDIICAHYKNTIKTGPLLYVLKTIPQFFGTHVFYYFFFRPPLGGGKKKKKITSRRRENEMFKT